MGPAALKQQRRSAGKKKGRTVALKIMNSKFAFIGIDDVEVFGADRMNIDSDASLARAQQQIRRRFAAAAA